MPLSSAKGPRLLLFDGSETRRSPVEVGSFSMFLPLFTCGQYTWYCWWKKSCTTWDAENPVNNGRNYQPQLVQDFWTIKQYVSFRSSGSRYGIFPKSFAFFFLHSSCDQTPRTPLKKPPWPRLTEARYGAYGGGWNWPGKGAPLVYEGLALTLAKPTAPWTKGLPSGKLT